MDSGMKTIPQNDEAEIKIEDKLPTRKENKKCTCEAIFLCTLLGISIFSLLIYVTSIHTSIGVEVSIFSDPDLIIKLGKKPFSNLNYISVIKKNSTDNTTNNVIYTKHSTDNFQVEVPNQLTNIKEMMVEISIEKELTLPIPSWFEWIGLTANSSLSVPID